MGGVVGRALALDEAVEPGAEQFGLEPVVERVAWRARHLRPGHQQFRLAVPLPSQRHATPAARVQDQPNQAKATSSTGCKAWLDMPLSVATRATLRSAPKSGFRFCGLASGDPAAISDAGRGACSSRTWSPCPYRRSS